MASCTGWGESFQCNANKVQQRENIAMKYTIIVANQVRTMVDFLALQYKHVYRIELYLGEFLLLTSLQRTSGLRTIWRRCHWCRNRQIQLPNPSLLLQ